MKKHSKKPNIIKNKIIELFARTCNDNSICVGNEITSNDFNVDINNIINQQNEN